MVTAAARLLDAETFSASSERDALGRVLTAVSPDGSNVHYHYDEGGALQRVTLHHRGSATEQTPVGEINYDAKGRRESITHGPLASPTSTTNDERLREAESFDLGIMAWAERRPVLEDYRGIRDHAAGLLRVTPAQLDFPYEDDDDLWVH